jgi:Flp pilus assembly protein TadB
VNLPLLPLTLSWLGMSCIAAALVGRSEDATRAARRLGGAYDRSAFGRRLQLRLEAACIDLRPAEWRLAQAVVSLPLTLAVFIVVGPSWLALSVSITAVRTTGRIALRVRRGRRDHLLGEAAPHLARQIGAELVAGSTAGEALRALHMEGSHRSSPVRAAVSGCVARMALGSPPPEALCGAVAELTNGATTPGAVAMERVATQFVLENEAGGDGSGLRRLATTLDTDGRVQAAARVTTVELRLASVAVPALSAAVAAMLVAGDRAMTAALFTLPETLILLTCALVAAAGVAGVRRITTV